MTRELDDPVVTAIYDLARIVLLSGGEFESKADVIRRLDELGIPAGRISLILQEPLNHVTSVLAKAKKRKGSR
jgi:hypothetical protein